MATPRSFPWDGLPQKLSDALRDQCTVGRPLVPIWEDATIGSYANRSRDSFRIDDAAIQKFKNCLNGDQENILNAGRAVTVSGYTVDGKRHKLKLKTNQGSSVLEGPWKSIMKKYGWDEGTEICFWGFPYGGRDSGEPCFVFTNNI